MSVTAGGPSASRGAVRDVRRRHQPAARGAIAFVFRRTHRAQGASGLSGSPGVSRRPGRPDADPHHDRVRGALGVNSERRRRMGVACRGRIPQALEDGGVRRRQPDPGIGMGAAAQHVSPDAARSLRVTVAAVAPRHAVCARRPLSSPFGPGAGAGETPSGQCRASRDIRGGDRP